MKEILDLKAQLEQMKKERDVYRDAALYYAMIYSKSNVMNKNWEDIEKEVDGTVKMVLAGEKTLISHRMSG
jgi:hypothetical protein